MKSTADSDEPEFICPQCGLVLLNLAVEPEWREHPYLEHSSATKESCSSLGGNWHSHTAPIGYFTHGYNLLSLNGARLLAEDSDDGRETQQT